MEVREIRDKNIWENFLLDCNEKTFLDSWNWGEFQKNMGSKIWRLGIYGNEILISSALVYKIEAKRGTFLFVPHGPIIMKHETYNAKQVLEVLLDELKIIAKKEHAVFVRIAPILERSQKHIGIFKELGFKEAPIHIHPELTWELDITPSEKELLMGMRKTTRYLIRKAQKEGVGVFASQDVKDLEIFYKLYEKVVSRQHFVPFTLNYLKNEFLAFQPDNQILIFLAKYKEEIISSGVFVFWQNLSFYHHGASTFKYSKIPASYLVQWKAILEAKKRGCKYHNFWGIAPTDNKKHPWAGLTLFKKGFGGYKKEYVKTQDLVLSSKYWLNFAVEKIRKTKRGF